MIVKIWDKAVVKRKKFEVIFVVCLIHILTADYETNGLLAVQPFNVKNLFLLVMLGMVYRDIIKDGRDGKITDSLVHNLGPVIKHVCVTAPIILMLAIFLIFVLPKLLGYESFDQIPTLWLGFKP